MDVVRTIDPLLYEIKLFLDETGVNPSILPSIIRSIGNMSSGSGYGKVQIFMENRRITLVKGEETQKIEQPASIDNENNI